MRFRKRVSLGKGARLNLSKSGVSLTAGVKGASLNFGNKGTFLNTGIPGTGLYNRTKIGGNSNIKHDSYLAHFEEEDNGIPSEVFEGTRLNVTIVYQDDGSVVLKDPSGHEITDPELDRMIKTSPEFKMEFERMSNERMEEYATKMDSIVSIQEKTPKVYSTEEWKNRILAMKPTAYAPRAYDEPQPLMDDVIYDLTLEANRTIDVRSKRKRQKLVERYVEETQAAEYNNRLRAWQERKAAFDTQEEKELRLFMEEEVARVDRQKQQYMELVKGNKAFVEKAIDSWLSTVNFDVEFNLDYGVVGDIILVDLDLPEIEDLPDKKAQKMANGTAKYKPKSKKEIKEDYSKCVFGLAIFFAGNIFNKALNADRIVMSGYTQRRNKVGDIVDDYIYSIQFDRATFETLNYMNGDPQANCMLFTNRVLQNADCSFKAIIPYAVEDYMEAQ